MLDYKHKDLSELLFLSEKKLNALWDDLLKNQKKNKSAQRFIKNQNMELTS